MPAYGLPRDMEGTWEDGLSAFVPTAATKLQEHPFFFVCGLWIWELNRGLLGALNQRWTVIDPVRRGLALPTEDSAGPWKEPRNELESLRTVDICIDQTARLRPELDSDVPLSIRREVLSDIRSVDALLVPAFTFWAFLPEGDRDGIPAAPDVFIKKGLRGDRFFIICL